MHQDDSQSATSSPFQDAYSTGSTHEAHIHSDACGTHCHTHESVLRKNLPRAKQVPKIGRNDPCPCGSLKKYKKCCLR
ncbi:MAG: SEC-C domain-containing protein [Alphaproteobacteria bacterium]|nr:SEC-C domain-containing protein [Alphaproteobacteria bacterium]